MDAGPGPGDRAPVQSSPNWPAVVYVYIYMCIYVYIHKAFVCNATGCKVEMNQFGNVHCGVPGGARKWR